MLHPIDYHFSQPLAVPAQAAYAWCTNFTTEDHQLMGNENANREITRLSNDTLILKDILQTNSGTTEKQKLVHLYPERLTWVSTHITGPNQYSQFIYKITANGDGTSTLEFTALHIERQENLSQTAIEVLKDELRSFDSNIWKRLAKAMEQELKEKQH